MWPKAEITSRGITDNINPKQLNEEDWSRLTIKERIKMMKLDGHTDSSEKTNDNDPSLKTSKVFATVKERVQAMNLEATPAIDSLRTNNAVQQPPVNEKNESESKNESGSKNELTGSESLPTASMNGKSQTKVKNKDPSSSVNYIKPQTEHQHEKEMDTLNPSNSSKHQETDSVQIERSKQPVIKETSNGSENKNKNIEALSLKSEAYLKIKKRKKANLKKRGEQASIASSTTSDPLSDISLNRACQKAPELKNNHVKTEKRVDQEVVAIVKTADEKLTQFQMSSTPPSNRYREVSSMKHSSTEVSRSLTGNLSGGTPIISNVNNNNYSIDHSHNHNLSATLSPERRRELFQSAKTSSLHSKQQYQQFPSEILDGRIHYEATTSEDQFDIDNFNVDYDDIMEPSDIPTAQYSKNNVRGMDDRATRNATNSSSCESMWSTKACNGDENTYYISEPAVLEEYPDPPCRPPSPFVLDESMINETTDFECHEKDDLWMPELFLDQNHNVGNIELSSTNPYLSPSIESPPDLIRESRKQIAKELNHTEEMPSDEMMSLGGTCANRRHVDPLSYEIQKQNDYHNDFFYKNYEQNSNCDRLGHAPSIDSTDTERTSNVTTENSKNGWEFRNKLKWGIWHGRSINDSTASISIKENVSTQAFSNSCTQEDSSEEETEDAEDTENEYGYEYKTTNSVNSMMNASENDLTPSHDVSNEGGIAYKCTNEVLSMIDGVCGGFGLKSVNNEVNNETIETNTFSMSMQNETLRSAMNMNDKKNEKDISEMSSSDLSPKCIQSFESMAKSTEIYTQSKHHGTVSISQNLNDRYDTSSG